MYIEIDDIDKIQSFYRLLWISTECDVINFLVNLKAYLWSALVSQCPKWNITTVAYVPTLCLTDPQGTRSISGVQRAMDKKPDVVSNRIKLARIGNLILNRPSYIRPCFGKLIEKCDLTLRLWSTRSYWKLNV